MSCLWQGARGWPRSAPGTEIQALWPQDSGGPCIYPGGWEALGRDRDWASHQNPQQMQGHGLEDASWSLGLKLWDWRRSRFDLCRKGCKWESWCQNRNEVQEESEAPFLPGLGQLGARAHSEGHREAGALQVAAGSPWPRPTFSSPHYASPIPGQVWLALPTSSLPAPLALTCVVDDKAGVAHWSIAAEGEEETVAAAFDAAGKLGAVEASYEGAERVPSVVDMEEVVARLQVKAGEQTHPDPTPLRSHKGWYPASGSTKGQGPLHSKSSSPQAPNPWDLLAPPDLPVREKMDKAGLDRAPDSSIRVQKAGAKSLTPSFFFFKKEGVLKNWTIFDMAYKFEGYNMLIDYIYILLYDFLCSDN